jgi:hypothetical protein
MLKAIHRLATWLVAPSHVECLSGDPLSHPLIERMDERELADLPLSPFPAGRHRCQP